MSNFYMAEQHWKKIMNYSQAAYDNWKSEISGMMIAYKDKEGDYLLTEPVILKQEVSAGNTVLDKDALAEYYVKTAMKHKNKPDMQFVWWHSHHTMEAFWSGTDLNTIQEMSEGKMSLSLVVNLKQEYKFRVSIWDPIEMHKDIEIQIMGKEKKIPAKIMTEVTAMCEKPTTSISQYKRPTQGYLSTLYAEDDGQTTLFNVSFKKEDPTLTNLESDVDDIIADYCAGMHKYEDVVGMFAGLNKQMEEEKKIYRVGIPQSIEELDSVCYFLMPYKYIHKYTEDWSVEKVMYDEMGGIDESITKI